MSSSSEPADKLATAKAVLSAAASFAATAMVARSVARDFLPYELQDYLFSGIRTFFARFSSQTTLLLDEFDGLVPNQIYTAAETYLSSKVPHSARRLRATKPEKEAHIAVNVEHDEEIVDAFDGVQFTWVLICRQVESRNYNPHDINSILRSEQRSYQITFHKKHKSKVIDSYLPHILEKSKSVKQEQKTLKIFTVDPDSMYGNMGDAWKAVNLDHPARFETLAMDPRQKEEVLADLERFVRRKEYYRKVGKAWKRGYLLYGPPGTGKSSLIAAMANYLRFDVYDLELTEMRSNSELRRLLIATANRSILVVEDIDCTIEFQDRMAEARAAQPPGTFQRQENQVTLSGLLNFIDGLWSSCGDERIIVFTTNHREKLDPALLRPGRMDLHVHMSYCTPAGFRLLASNYLSLSHHSLFEDIEALLEPVEVTPAEVAEQLMKSDEIDSTLSGLLEFLKLKMKEKEEAKAKRADQESAAAVAVDSAQEKSTSKDDNAVEEKIVR
ncbi:AAA-ATPase At3g50940-like [Malania oleifera]|uniref:AAA-ATPase At3g50940-like n=1 Tax=Malania oleifera TaxID=397392 RepID=UPI0025AE00B1|nr:AAA-ATPase At3g50940-like [Malania oleifera]